jgi:hypothetical protein
MKVNYNIVEEINRRSLVGTDGNQLACFYLIQAGLERFLNGDTLSNDYIKFLLQLGVLEEETQDEKKKIVEPFNFTGNGPQGN